MHKLVCRILCIALVSFLTACGGGADQKTTSAAGVTFSFGDGALVSAKAAKAVKSVLSPTLDPAAKFVLVTATDASGTPVLNNYKAEIYTLNNSYITAPIPLNSGNYQLTSFLVLDSNNNVLYLVPTQGATADIKALISTVLPMPFQINGNQPNAVTVQVLAPDSTPADFGYPTFSFTPVSYVSFLSQVQVQGVGTTAALTVNGVTYNHPAAASRLRVAQANSYLLVFSKAGYFSQSLTFTATDIANYQSTPLVITLVPVPTTCVINFYSNGGTTVSPKTVNIGSQIILPTDPTRPGYTFGGWYLDLALTSPLPAGYTATGDITFYAKWIYNPAQCFAWTGVGTIMIDGALRTSPYLLPTGTTAMNVVISGASGGDGDTGGTLGEKRTFNALSIIAGTYTITLGGAGQNGQLSLVHDGSGYGPTSGAGGGGASTIKIGGTYVAGAAGGAGGGAGGFSPNSSPIDQPGGTGGSGDGYGGNGQDADGYLGIDGYGGAGGTVNTGGPAVGGTVTGSNTGAGTIVVTTSK